MYKLKQLVHMLSSFLEDTYMQLISMAPKDNLWTNFLHRIQHGKTQLNRESAYHLHEMNNACLFLVDTGTDITPVSPRLWLTLPP